MDIKNEIIKIVQQKESDLPTLPVVVRRIISAASDPDITTKELAKVISFDQGMVNKLLRLSNSIYYAQKTKVETVERAISVIGFDEIIGIALSMNIISSFTRNSGFNLDMKALWIHGIGCATVAKELAKRTNPTIAGKVFVPALLHDMGKVLFTVYFKKEYNRVRRLALENKKTLYFVENALFKMDHATLAGLMLKRWGLPSSIIIPCRYHHDPENCPVKLKHQALILNLANYLTQKAGIGYSGNQHPVAVKGAFRKIGTTEQVVKLVISQLQRKEAEINDFFKITTEEAP